MKKYNITATLFLMMTMFNTSITAMDSGGYPETSTFEYTVSIENMTGKPLTIFFNRGPIPLFKEKTIELEIGEAAKLDQLIHSPLAKITIAYADKTKGKAYPEDIAAQDKVVMSPKDIEALATGQFAIDVTLTEEGSLSYKLLSKIMAKPAEIKAFEGKTRSTSEKLTPSAEEKITEKPYQ